MNQQIRTSFSESIFFTRNPPSHDIVLVFLLLKVKSSIFNFLTKWYPVNNSQDIQIFVFHCSHVFSLLAITLEDNRR